MPCRLPRADVRAYVQERIDEACTHLAPDAQESIAFVLPREWLNEPVAHWARGADDDTPLPGYTFRWRVSLSAPTV
ncbi:hypothetical protein [Streptomyces avermitilis]|uniref:VMAP-C domain-containing protein n=1 Tax=Streptomyces avermitilis TaxID=33903 RepID=UPI003F4D310F